MNAIETKALAKRYKTVTAVDGLDLTVRQGELFALLGQNGAGKTSTIRMLCGQTQPTAGEAWIMGHSVLHEAQQAKAVLNLSPQETAIAPNLTVKENLLLLARLYGASQEEAACRAQELLETFELVQRAKERAKKLSGGMQRRLSIAMAMVTQPQVLFLDEPTLGLDVRARRELWQTIRGLKGKVTLVLTTHYLEEAEALADRICILCSGKVRSIGTPRQLMEQTGTQHFEDAFLALTEAEG